ncbi:MAG: CDP-glycerol glycerophosphotransferase family protein [Eubacterium sp.]|nr:CDP-glycerol glycerophosphotransferase family protein [Eubacterium sp.]
MKKLKSLLYPFLQRLKYIKLIRLFKKAQAEPLEKNKILMLSTSKGKLGGNLLALKSYIEKQGPDYKINTVTSLNMPDLKTLAAELATSGYIMVDDYEPMVYPLSLRREQELVQVWHALGAFKKFGYARETAEKNSLTHKNYTKATVSSPELISLYAESFGISVDKVIPVGAPRTDCFFDAEYRAAAKERLYNRAPQLRDKKVILFAPTFRGRSVNDGYYPEEYFSPEELMKELESGWALIIKLHPFIKNKIEIPASLKDRVFDFSDEREINDILFITDVLVTDYSSVIYENAVIGGACVHYAPDLDEYGKERGFYFPYNDYLCGELVKDKTALAQAVLNAKADDERMISFKNRFVSLCDGNSCRRFADMILEER